MIMKSLTVVAAAPVRLLFPPRCLSCGAMGEMSRVKSLCPDCYGKVVLPPRNLCAVCARPLDFDYELETGDTYSCGECMESPPPYKQLKFALVYEGPARELVHRFKYKNERALAGDLAGLGKDALVPWLERMEDAVIIPAPLAIGRLFKRGYNPAYLLARRYGKWTGLEVAEGVLRRIRATAPQFGLSREERRENVKGAFAVRDARAIRGRRVILFDDIHTTGATVEECCKTLRKAKPEEISVATLCRAGQ